LAYYYDHREEIDRQMKESEEFARAMEASNIKDSRPNPVRLNYCTS
jgi:hypothetical protein